MIPLSEWFFVLLPMLLGFAMSRICPNVGQMETTILKAQPPGWVFGVVWPVLYLAIGIAWMLSRRNSKIRRIVDLVFIVNLVCINAWIWLYGCKQSKEKALWTFIPSIATAIMAMMVVYEATGSSWPAILLAPYVAWLIFASQLNFARVA